MPEVIASTSRNYSALIGSMVRPYYFRADGGAFVDTLFGPDLSKAFQDGSFQTAIVAHKVELALVYPQRQDYKARRPLTIGEFYVNELFQEVWCLPIRSCHSPLPMRASASWLAADNHLCRHKRTLTPV